MKYHVFLFIFLSIFFIACTDSRFDSTAWRNWEENEHQLHARWDMVDDLMANHLKEGMSESDILAKLGHPDYRGKGEVIEWRFNLGPCRKGIDYGTLHIIMKKGKLQKTSKSCS